jgi:hypothetical protein
MRTRRRSLPHGSSCSTRERNESAADIVMRRRTGRARHRLSPRRGVPAGRAKTCACCQVSGPMLAAFLGAGFSQWAADLPLAADLFDFNVRFRTRWEARRIDLVQDERHCWRDENPRGLSEQFIAWALNLPQIRRTRIVWDVTRRLSEPFLCRISVEPRHSRSMTPHKGITRGRDCATIPSALLGLRRVRRCDLQFRHAGGVRADHEPFQLWPSRGATVWPRAESMVPCARTESVLRGHFPLATLHGSVSWDAERRYTDRRRRLSGMALIVPPRPEKTPPPELLPTWKLAEQIRSRAERLVVFRVRFQPLRRGRPRSAHSDRTPAF